MIHIVRQGAAWGAWLVWFVASPAFCRSSFADAPTGQEWAEGTVRAIARSLGLDPDKSDWSVQSLGDEGYRSFRVIAQWTKTPVVKDSNLDGIGFAFGSDAVPTRDRLIFIKKDAPGWKAVTSLFMASESLAKNLLFVRFSSNFGLSEQRCEATKIAPETLRKFFEGLAEIGRLSDEDARRGRAGRCALAFSATPEPDAFAIVYEPPEISPGWPALAWADPRVGELIRPIEHDPSILDGAGIVSLPPGTLELIKAGSGRGEALIALGAEGLCFQAPAAADKSDRFRIDRLKLSAYEAPVFFRVVDRPPAWLSRVARGFDAGPIGGERKARLAALAVCSPARWRDDPRHRYPADPEIWALRDDPTVVEKTSK